MEITKLTSPPVKYFLKHKSFFQELGQLNAVERERIKFLLASGETSDLNMLIRKVRKLALRKQKVKDEDNFRILDCSRKKTHIAKHICAEEEYKSIMKGNRNQKLSFLYSIISLLPASAREVLGGFGIGQIDKESKDEGVKKSEKTIRLGSKSVVGHLKNTKKRLRSAAELDQSVSKKPKRRVVKSKEGKVMVRKPGLENVEGKKTRPPKQPSKKALEKVERQKAQKQLKEQWEMDEVEENKKDLQTKIKKKREGKKVRGSYPHHPYKTPRDSGLGVSFEEDSEHEGDEA